MNNLTPEQITKFPEYVKKYTNIGLDTTPIDFEKAKEVVKLCYEKGGLIPLEKIVYCKSPFSAILDINLLRQLNSKSVRGSVYQLVMDAVQLVMDAVRDSVYQSVSPSVLRSVRNSVSNSVSDSVSDSVWHLVRDSIWQSVKDSISDSKLEFISSTLEGQHNVGLVSLYEYLRHECGLKEETEPMTAIFELTKTTGWVYLYQNIAFICDRPCKLYRDDKGRLHSDDCAALEYADGYKIYAWHGTRVSEYVILNPEKITIKDILQEKNSEIRRVKIMRFGIDNFIKNEEVIKMGHIRRIP